jgi:hypothetical protein
LRTSDIGYRRGWARANRWAARGDASIDMLLRDRNLR